MMAPCVQGFEHHVMQDHNMWAYVHLSIYLDLIDVSNHHALEQYIYRKVSTQSGGKK